MDKKDLKAGVVYQVIDSKNQAVNGMVSGFAVGSLIELYRDDGSWVPLFKLVEGECNYNLANNEAGTFIHLDDVVPYIPIKPRAHADIAEQYFMDDTNLAFVKLGEVSDVSYFVYVETPMFQENEDYMVTNEFTVEEARADRNETIKAFSEASREAAKAEQLEKDLEALADNFLKDLEAVLGQAAK